MGFQFFSGRSNGFLVRCVLVVSIAPFMVACAKGGFPSKPKPLAPAPTLAELQTMLPDAEMEKGWEKKFEALIQRNGLVADRYEWQAPVRGSYIGQDSRSRRGTSRQVSWFGCGWAYYVNPPGGVVGHAARIAAKFDEGKLTSYINLNEAATQVCRHAPVLLPTNVPTAETPGGIDGEERKKANKSITRFIGKGEKIQTLHGGSLVSTAR